MIHVPEGAIGVIQEHAIEAFPEECCGFLLGHVGEPKRVIEARRGKNIATEDRARRYIIDPLEMLHVDDDARTKGMDLIGIYHSHPNHPAVPSEFDRSRATPWYLYLILSIVDRDPREIAARRGIGATNRVAEEQVRPLSAERESVKPRTPKKREARHTPSFQAPQ